MASSDGAERRYDIALQAVALRATVYIANKHAQQFRDLKAAVDELDAAADALFRSLETPEVVSEPLF